MLCGLESITKQGKGVHTFACIVPVGGCRVTTNNEESLQKGEQLCAG